MSHVGFWGMYHVYFSGRWTPKKWKVKVEEIFFFVQICFLKQSTRESIKYVDNDRDTFVDLFVSRFIQIVYLEFSRASGEWRLAEVSSEKTWDGHPSRCFKARVGQTLGMLGETGNRWIQVGWIRLNQLFWKCFFFWSRSPTWCPPLAALIEPGFQLVGTNFSRAVAPKLKVDSRCNLPLCGPESVLEPPIGVVRGKPPLDSGRCGRSKCWVIFAALKEGPCAEHREATFLCLKSPHFFSNFLWRTERVRDSTKHTKDCFQANKFWGDSPTIFRWVKTLKPMGDFPTKRRWMLQEVIEKIPVGWDEPSPHVNQAVVKLFVEPLWRTLHYLIAKMEHGCRTSCRIVVGNFWD